MERDKELISRIFSQEVKENFEGLALEVFRFQVENNPVYADYIKYLGRDYRKIKKLNEIPFLPIEFFKTKKIVTKHYQCPDNEFVVFKSSGTTQTGRSTHYIYNINVYEKSFVRGFEKFFGKISNYVILALLPSYLEAGDSSLVYMVKKLIELSGKKESGFFLYNYKELEQRLKILKNRDVKVILFGVSYALLDFAELTEERFDDLIIIETGGMKGRKREMIREELHESLYKKLGSQHIYSEYGMTELLSQAYQTKNKRFSTTETMQVFIRDINDPFSFLSCGKTGGINIIDLSNIYSCSFIETKDLGKKHNKSEFEILGRFDNSDIRGCNLLILR
jgi:phenylacetate-coenzyme A ligase PaaK-like adenylate-forming protein